MALRNGAQDVEALANGALELHRVRGIHVDGKVVDIDDVGWGRGLPSTISCAAELEALLRPRVNGPGGGALDRRRGDAQACLCQGCP